MKDLIVDARRLELSDGTSTGIFVRVKNADGTWGNADILHLERDSLIEWLRSRGEKNRWAEATVLTLLGHETPEGEW